MSDAEWLANNAAAEIKPLLVQMLKDKPADVKAWLADKLGTKKLAGKVIIVTGATSGLGKCTAVLLAKQGAKVVLTGRRQANGDKVVAEIQAAGGDAMFVKADVTKEEDCKNMVDKTLEAYGKLDGAFNNAGASEAQVGFHTEDGEWHGGLEALLKTADVPYECFKGVIDCNLHGVWRCMKYQLKAMEKNGSAGGSIVNCSSIYGVRASELGLSSYCASKHGVTGLSKCAAMEYASKNIRINSVHPGYVGSEMTSVFHDDPAYNAGIAMQMPLNAGAGGRWGKDIEIADGVSHCMSDESTWYTGQQLILDGGICAEHVPEAVSGVLAGMVAADPSPLANATPPTAEDGNVKGKVIIVTGATSGLGEATARLLASQGAKVVLTGRRQANGDKVVAEIQAAGGDAMFVKADVTKEEDCKRMVDETVEAYGKLDGAFNNSGVTEAVVGYKDDKGEWVGGLPVMAPVGDTRFETYKGVIDVNLAGVFLCAKHEIKAMIKNGGGSIVNCSSIYGYRGTNLGIAGYVSSKHAVNGLSKCIALEYAEKGIRCNTVHPGFCNSELTADFLNNPVMNKLTALNQPIDGGRWGKDTEIADGVSFLLSDKSTFMTAAPLILDGGLTASWMPAPAAAFLAKATAAAAADAAAAGK